MTPQELVRVLDAIGAVTEGDGRRLPEGCTASFHIAKDGVGLTVTRVVAVQLVGEQLQLRTEKGETCFVAVDWVFACVSDSTGRSVRRAGFA